MWGSLRLAPIIPMCPINFRWEETYTPTILPRSRSPHNAASYYTCMIRKWVQCVSAVTRQPLSLRVGARDNLGRGHGRGMGTAWHAVKYRIA